MLPTDQVPTVYFVNVCNHIFNAYDASSHA